MNKLVKNVLIGIALGGVSFLIIRLLNADRAGQDRWIMITLSVYIILGLLMSWGRAYVSRPNQTAHRVDPVSQKQDVKDMRDRASLVQYGYAFFLASATILLLDYFIR